MMLPRRSAHFRRCSTTALALLVITGTHSVLLSETPRSATFMVSPQAQNAPKHLLDQGRALAQQHIPYLFGGTSSKGMDCSASVQHLFQRLGILLPRTSEAQANHLARNARLWRVAPGETEKQVARRLQPGDLLFWTKSGQPTRISHVMMFVGLEQNGQFRLWGARGRGKTGLTGSGVDFYAYRPGNRHKSRLVAYGRPGFN